MAYVISDACVSCGSCADSCAGTCRDAGISSSKFCCSFFYIIFYWESSHVTQENVPEAGRPV